MEILPENEDAYCCRKYVLWKVHYEKGQKRIVLLDILNLNVSDAWQHLNRNISYIYNYISNDI